MASFPLVEPLMNCINLQPESKDARRRRLKLARHKRWRERNLESERARVRQWKRQNSKAVSAYNKDYHAQHREHALVRKAAWRDANPGYGLRYYAANIKKCREMHRRLVSRRRARKLGAKGTCTAAQLQARVDFYGGLCWVPGCGKAYEAIDHVIPLAKGGSNWPSNLRPICKHHNSVKGSKMPNHFLKKAA